MSKRILLIGLIIFKPCLAQETAESLVQNEVRPIEVVTDYPTSVLVIVDIVQKHEIFKKTTFEKVVGISLLRHGVRFSNYEGQFRSDFENKRLSRRALLSPKLVLEIETAKGDDTYTASCEISFIQYSGKPRLRGTRTWFRGPYHVENATIDGLEGSIIEYIQGELSAFGKFYRPKSNPAVSDRELPYKLRWQDPDRKRRHVFAGLTVGTPALLNLNIGYWGSYSVPIVINLSGMYFTTQTRGVELDLGWAVKNTGALRHVIAASLVGAHDQILSTSYAYDSLGRATDVFYNTVDRIAPYIGPSYILDWKNFRLECGAGYRLSQDSGSAINWIFQAGYALPIDLW